MLPRLAIFQTATSLKHMVMVDGTNCKAVCTRMPLRNGKTINYDATITCESCKNRGWTKSLGQFGRPPVHYENGRLLDWEQAGVIPAP